MWDYNLALGNADYLQGEQPTGWYYTQLSGTNYFWYQRLFQDTEFDLAIGIATGSCAADYFTTPNLMGLIDKHDAELDGDNGTPQCGDPQF